MADIELIGVPFDGYGRAGYQAQAASALRDVGLVAAFQRHLLAVVDDLDLPAPTRSRGARTGLINEPALLAMTDALNERVGAAVAGGRFPFVYGGDCATLLGTVSGLRDHVGDVGLVFVDGHEDTMPLDVSEDGEAANAEIGLLLGLTGRLLTGPLAARLPALRPEALAVLGPRDDDWRRRFNVGSLSGTGIFVAALPDVAVNPASAGRRAVAHLSRYSRHRWLHVDLDVLDPVEFPAQGLPGVQDDPGGLTWQQLTDLVIAVVEPGGCIGCSLAIYDPGQDTDRRCATQIVEFARRIAAVIS
jgi:arginase